MGFINASAANIHECISFTSYAPRQISKASAHIVLACGMPRCTSVLLRNMRNMSIIFMNSSHSLAVREAWIDCLSLSTILVSPCDMHASSTVTLPVKTSSSRFPTASRSVGVVSPVSPKRVVSASCTI